LTASPSVGGGTFTTNGGTDVYLAKFAGPTGAHDWSIAFGGPEDDGVGAIAIDNSGDVVAAGSFRGLTDFGTGSVTSASSRWTFR